METLSNIGLGNSNMSSMMSMGVGTVSEGDAHFFEDTTTPAKVRQLLDSMKEVDKLKGMKLLLAMLSKGRDIPEFFPDVVKNVVVKSIEVKKMVYIYLVHYADFNPTCREIALLSINSFQKDLAGSNQLIRGLALRVMTSIRVGDIIQIQLLAVRKCASDSSPYVRKCAANALPKIFSMDNSQLEHCKQLLEQLLKDSCTMVLGSAVAAFNEICPTSYDILHKSYRKLCHLLADMDEWNQVSVLEAMTRYLRNQFTDPLAPGVAAAAKQHVKQRSAAAMKGQVALSNPLSSGRGGGKNRFFKRRVVKKAFYSDEEDESGEEMVEMAGADEGDGLGGQSRPELGSVFTGENADTEGDLDPDHRLALKSSMPLLKSRNTGVVLAVCSLHHYCGAHGSQSTTQIAKALIRILKNRREVQYVVLNCINAMARERPLMFRPFLSEFFVKSSDPIFNKLLKLEILTSLCCRDNIESILKELQIYVKEKNCQFVCTAIRSIGRVADAALDSSGGESNTMSLSSSAHSSFSSSIASTCMEGIMHLLICSRSKSDTIVSECVVVLRQLLQQNAFNNSGSISNAANNTVCVKILRQLVKLLIVKNGLESEATARSSVVWLVGEFHHMLDGVAPDVLRILAAGFTDESTLTKTQILNLAIKLSLSFPEDDRLQSLMTYILEMARYDTDTDLRDRARFMTALVGLAPDSEGVEQTKMDETVLAEFAEHAKGILLIPKLPPVTLLGSVAIEGIQSFTVGSMSSLLGHNIQGYEALPQWPKKQPDATVRDVPRNAPNDTEHSLGGQSDSRAHGIQRHRSSSAKSEIRDSESEDNDGDLKSFYGKGGGNNIDMGSSSSSGSASGDDGSGSDPDSDYNSDSGSQEGNSDRESADDDDNEEDVEEEDDESTASDSSSVAVPLRSQTKKASSGPAITAAPAANPTIGSKLQQTTALPMRKVTKKSAPGASNIGGGNLHTPNTQSMTLLDTGGFDFHATSSTSKLQHPSESSLLSFSTDSVSSPNSLLPGYESLQPQPSGKRSTDTANAIDQLFANPNANLNSALLASSAISSIDVFPNTNLVHVPNNLIVPYGQGPLAPMSVPTYPALPTTMSPMMVPQSAMPGGYIPAYNAMSANNPVMNPSIVMNSNPNSNASNSTSLVSEEKLSSARSILKPELGGGLGVHMMLRFNAQPVAFAGASSVLLVLKNHSDHTIRRIKVSFPSDVRKTALPDTPLLNAGQEIALPMEIVLAGAAKQIKVEVRCDQGSYSGQLLVNDCDLLQPLRMTSSDFDGARRRLSGGFNELISKPMPLQSLLALPAPIPQDSDSVHCAVSNLIRSEMNLHLVQGGPTEVMFAGCFRKGATEEKALLSIKYDDSSASITLRFNCDDVVMSASLQEMLKKILCGLKYSQSSPIIYFSNKITQLLIMVLNGRHGSKVIGGKMSGTFKLMMQTYPSEVSAYAQCLKALSETDDISKGGCEKQFQALKDCFKKCRKKF